MNCVDLVDGLLRCRRRRAGRSPRRTCAPCRRTAPGAASRPSRSNSAPICSKREPSVSPEPAEFSSSDADTCRRLAAPASSARGDLDLGLGDRLAAGRSRRAPRRRPGRRGPPSRRTPTGCRSSAGECRGSADGQVDQIGGVGEVRPDARLARSVAVFVDLLVGVPGSCQRCGARQKDLHALGAHRLSARRRTSRVHPRLRHAHPIGIGSSASNAKLPRTPDGVFHQRQVRGLYRL